MNSVLPLEDYNDRRILLADYLQQYKDLVRDEPEVAEKLSFDAFVQFSFSYYTITTQIGKLDEIEDHLK